MNLLSYFKSHFYGTSTFQKTALVAKVAHQKQAAASTTFYSLRTSGIWYYSRIETGTFIAYPNRQGIALSEEGNRDALLSVALISVEDGICNCFSQTHHNISFPVGGEVVATGEAINKGFHLFYIPGV